MASHGLSGAAANDPRLRASNGGGATKFIPSAADQPAETPASGLADKLVQGLLRRGFGAEHAPAPAPAPAPALDATAPHLQGGSGVSSCGRADFASSLLSYCGGGSSADASASSGLDEVFRGPPNPAVPPPAAKPPSAADFLSAGLASAAASVAARNSDGNGGWGGHAGRPSLTSIADGGGVQLVSRPASRRT